MKLDLDDAELFLRIAELGSLSAAARERDLPVSQVSRALARLEARCGARLMHRSTHSLSLTDEGDTFAGHARRLLETRDELAASFARQRAGPSGWVRVSVSPVLAETVIAPSLPSLHERHPQLQLEVMADDRISDMARDGVDIAVRTGTAHSDQLIALPLAEHGRRLCAAPGYLARFGTPRHPDELSQHRLITHSVNAVLNRWPYAAGKGYARGAVYQARGHTRSDNSAVTMALALQGAGIARLNDLLSREHMARGALVPVLDDWFDRSRVPIVAVMLPERHRLPKLRACIDHWRDWLAGRVRAPT
ncbi:MAG: LysR family transcriptional regulator [Hydrogenophaga sp.]|uniref:LysR family transcriptional regulator n=1 Tax=Hydrogenophaga sp. TaxID=1904254 RepID=UPI00169C47CD|nr:LysR family transcriptional regulator [Hydrogenophaga sp.]NIM40051.1 LysR family transcriptional regulator [Hydrogenophaga sp.]NIN25247.1 LysR family transcriptional regulator [Hydrogenophaga sp.]NIN29814.1 LysR family transcriptional regulator [Hydrogenophaga sp.]NIN54286.1 LysR family transcriptional regulator [Hydrogenophaga sp.]NIO50699.1 LysR family transcriptional regulator [Hydrogenophaga sp.]